MASVAVLAIIVAAALKQLGDHGQLAAYRWQAFTTVPYLRVLGEGLWGTLKATGMSAVLAFPLGALLALMRLSRRRPVRMLAVGYIEVFRSIPLLLLIYAFLLALPRYGVNLPVFWKLVVPIVMVMSAIIAEVFRAGILALDRGQSEAAEAIGFRYWQAMRLVILPQATRLVLPSLIAQLVTVLKESTLGYAVSYPELMKQGDFLTARTHLLFQTFVIVAVIYVVINFLLGRLASLVERRLSRRTGGAGPRATQDTQLANAPNAGLAPTA
jgi:glutamate transport system permease protein